RGMMMNACGTCMIVWLCLGAFAPASAVEPWATYRGNQQRSGNTDGMSGPATPKVLWALKTKDHHMASPVPAGDCLFISGLGAFNLANLSCVSMDPAASRRVLWSESPPYLKLPRVRLPGFYGGQMVFR